MSPDDIPKYMRYDFFMAVLGVLISYFSFSNANIYGISTLRWSMFGFGAILSIYGIGEMSSTYYNEKKIQKIRNKINLADVKKN